MTNISGWRKTHWSDCLLSIERKIAYTTQELPKKKWKGIKNYQSFLFYAVNEMKKKEIYL